MGKGRDARDTLSDWASYYPGFHVCVMVILLIYGATLWAWVQVEEIENTAQKNWVHGKCKVLDRKSVERYQRKLMDDKNLNEIIHRQGSRYLRTSTSSTSSSSRKTMKYNTKIKVKRVSEDGVEGNATVVNLPKEQAWKFPYMTWYEGGSTKRFNLEMWYTTKSDAIAVKKKYTKGDIVNCYWNPKDVDEVSLTLRGGDWIHEHYVVPGMIMVFVFLGCCIFPMFCLFCCYAISNMCHEDHPVNKHVATPVLAHADSIQQQHIERAKFVRQVSAKFMNPKSKPVVVVEAVDVNVVEVETEAVDVNVVKVETVAPTI